MKVKPIIATSLIGLILFILCISGCSDSPKEIAKDWYEAILDYDLESANEHTIDCIKDNNYEIVSLMLRNRDFRDNFKKQVEQALEMEPVVNKEEGYAIFGDFIYLIKYDGEWRVLNYFDFDKLCVSKAETIQKKTSGNVDKAQVTETKATNPKQTTPVVESKQNEKVTEVKTSTEDEDKIFEEVKKITSEAIEKHIAN